MDELKAWLVEKQTLTEFIYQEMHEADPLGVSAAFRLGQLEILREVANMIDNQGPENDLPN